MANAADSTLNRWLSESPLSSHSFIIRYKPIVMKSDRISAYPVRSRSEIRKGIHNYYPQLDHGRFVFGSESDRINIYLDGFVEFDRHLKNLVSIKKQVVAFSCSLAEARSELLRDSISRQH